MSLKQTSLRILVFSLLMCLGFLIVIYFYRNANFVSKKKSSKENMFIINNIQEKCNNINLGEGISNKDKAYIVKLLLEKQLENTKLLDIGRTYILGNDKIRFVSTQNISKSLLPKIPGNIFYLLTPEEIDSENFNKEGIKYVSFSPFINEKQDITITIYENYRMPIYYENYGFIYQFHKTTCGWTYFLIGHTRATT